VGVDPKEEVGHRDGKLQEGHNVQQPLFTAQVVLDLLGVGVVNNSGEVEHEKADKGSQGHAPVHGCFYSLRGDGQGHVEESILIVQVVAVLDLFGDGFLFCCQTNDFISLSAAVDSFHDIGAGGPREVFKDVVLGEEEGLIGIISAIDFDLYTQQIISKYFDVICHVVEIHVIDQPEMEFFHWRLVVQFYNNGGDL